MDTFYYMLESPKNKSYEIKWKEDKTKVFQNTFRKFKEYEEYKIKLYENRKKCLKDEIDALTFFNKQYIYHVLFRTHTDLIRVKLISLKDNDECCSYEEKITRRVVNIHKKKNIKYKKIVSTVVSQSIYEMMQSMSYCKRQKLIYRTYIRSFIKLYDILEIGGNFYFHYFALCNSQDIEMIYLLSLLFDKVIIVDSVFIQCIGYRGELKISKEQCYEILKHKKFSIQPKMNEKELNQYFVNNLKLKNNGLYLCLKNDKKKIDEYYFKKGLLSLIQHDYNSRYLSYFLEKYSYIITPLNVYTKYIYKILDDYYKKRGNELHKIIRSMNKLKKTDEIKILEIGLSFGIYAKMLMKNKKILLDVVESKKIWNSFGTKYIEKYKKRIHYYQENITTFLTDLTFRKNKYNFVLITNIELFDIQLIHIYYSLQLLLNTHHSSCLIIEKCINEDLFKYIEYMKTNFTFLEFIDNEYFYIFKKIKNDNREFIEYNIY